MPRRIALRPLARTLTRCALAFTLALACSDGATGPERATVASIDAVDGDEQQGVVGEELAEPLVARLLDADGNPVSGQTVVFRVTSGGGSMFAGVGVSNANGLVQDRWTLGTSTTTPQEVEVRAVDPATGQGIVFKRFSATATPAAASAFVKVSGDAQNGIAGAALANQLTVRVTDRYGNAVPGVATTWSAANGSVNPTTVTSDAQGLSKTTWTLGNVAGSQSASVSATGLTAAAFTATVGAAAASSIVASAGTGQSAVVGTQLPNPIVVRVTDAFGNPVAGVTVNWSVASGGGSVSAATSTTDASGLASTQFTLGTTAGTQSVRASVAGISPIEISATAQPALGFLIAEITRGQGQTGTVGATLPEPLEVRVRDTYGNPVPGLVVSWTPASGSGTVTPSQSTTGADGTARTAWTVGATEGTHRVTAEITGVNPQLFTARVIVAQRWSAMTSPTTQALRDIWGRSASDIFAVGDQGTIIHFDGNSWQSQSSGTSVSLTRVWGLPNGKVYATDDASVLLEYSGGSWSAVTMPTRPGEDPGNPRNMWVNSPTAAVAVVNEPFVSGAQDSVMVWNGQTWTTTLRGIRGATQPWMAPTGEILIGQSELSDPGWHFDGTSWNPGPSGGRTFSFTGPSFNDYWAHGNRLGGCCTLRHFTGLANDYTYAGDYHDNRDGWFVSPNEVYLFNPAGVGGLRRMTPDDRFDGVDEGVDGNAIWGASATDLFLVGEGGSIWRRNP